MFEPWKPHREVKERKPLWDYSGCIGSENDAAADNKPSSAVRTERTEIPKEANDDMTVLLVQTDLGEMMSETNTLLRQFAASQSCEVMRWGGGWVLLAPSASAGARTGSILQRRLHQVSAGERPEGEELRSCHIGIHTGKRNNDPTQPPFIDVVATASVAAHHCTGSQVMMSGSTSGQLTPQELERYGAVFRGSTTVDGQGSVDFYELTTPEAERQVNGRASVYVLFAALLEWLTADSPADEPASAPPPPPEPAAAPSTSAANPDEVAMLCSEEVRLPGARKSNVVAVVPESLTATEEVCRAGEAHPQQQQQQHQASHHDEVVQDAVVVPQQAWEVVEPRQTQPYHQHVISPRTEHDVVVYPLFAEEIRMPGATQSVLHPVQNTAAPQPTPPLTARWMPEEEANVQPLFAEEVKMPGASMSVRRAIEEDALGNPFPLHAIETRLPVARAPITEHNNAGQDPTFYPLPQVDAPPRTEEVYVPPLPLRAIEVRAPYAAASVVQTLSQPTLDVIEPPAQHEREVAYLHPHTEEVYVPPLPLRAIEVRAPYAAASVVQTLSQPTLDVIEPPAQHEREVAYLHPHTEEVYVPPLPLRAIEVRAPYATASVVQTLPQPPRQDAVELPVLWAYEEYPPRFISPNLDQNHWTLAEPQRTEEHEVQPLHAREVRRPSVSHSTIHNRSAMRSRSQRQGSYASLNPPVLRATEFMPPQHRIHTWSTSRDRLHSPTPPPPPPPAQDPQQSASLVQQSFYADEEEGRIVPNGYTHDSLPSRLHPHRQSHNSGHQEQPVEQVSAPTQVNSSPVIPPMEEYGEEVGRREVVAPPTTTAPNPFDRNGREDQWSPRDGDAADRESAATTAMRAPRLRPSTLDEASNAAAWGTWAPPPTIQPVTSEFRNGHPTMHYTSVSRCINCGNGLLFRLVEDTTGRWAYYNDTTDFNMLVRFTLGPRSNFVPLGYTKVYKDVDTGEYKGELWIPPLATSMLLVGHVRGFKMRYKGVPVSRAAAIEGRRFEHEHEQEEVMEF